MTDKEIIKAWEKVLSTGDAPIGEHWSVGGIVTTQLAKETLDLINRLQDEREALINGQETLQKTIVEKKAEIERLAKEVDCLSQCVMYHDEHIADAIKEFAERLPELVPRFNDGYTTIECVKGAIKHLVKELTESVNYGSSKIDNGVKE